MKESYFANELKIACKEFGYMYIKIPDSFNMQRFSPPKPFDCIIIANGLTFCIENKIVKDSPSIQIDRIKEHQIVALEQARLCGAYSYFFINWRYKKDNILCICEPRTIKELIQVYTNNGVKSIQINKIIEKSNIKPIKKIKTKNGTFWEINNFFENRA